MKQEQKKTTSKAIATPIAEGFMSMLLDSMSEGILACDGAGKVSIYNRAIQQFFNLPDQSTELDDWFAYAVIRDALDKKNVSIRQALVEPVLRGDQPKALELIVTIEAAPPRYIVVNGRAILDENQHIAGVVITAQDHTEERLKENRLEHLALFDSLTKLPSRAHLINRLQQEVAAAVRHASVGAILFVNLDKFRTINDSLGNAVGDELLRQVAQRILKEVREEDTIARLGGDEYVVVLPQLADIESDAVNKAQTVAKKILQSMVEPFDSLGFACNLTASIGIALFPTGGDHVDELLKHADIAMMRAKQEGHNRYCFFNQEMQEKADRRLILEQDVGSIIEKKEFEVRFQPIVDSDSNKVVGAEALARWNHPRYGELSPAEFIPIAEDYGVILTIGNWALMHALRSLKHWIGTGLVDDDIAISVNVSPKQLDDPEFVKYVLRALKIFELQPQQLKLEITEGVLLGGTQDPVSKMEILRKEGVRFSIDDFGTGYSSLHYIKRLPVDQLKIDRSFVLDIESDKDDAAITETILSIARHFDMEVVAEGVEQEAQIEVLKEMGCHIFQGYFFSRPLLSNEFVDWLKARGQTRIVGDV